MKILMIGNFGTGWDNSICDEKHISDALKDLGHTVIDIQREQYDVIYDNIFDFVLVSQWNGYPEHFCRELKKQHNCPVVYWAFDYQFDSNEAWHFEMAKEADLFLSKEMNNRKFYEDMGANFYWLPQDFAPEFLHEHPDEIEKKYEVVFTGSHLPQAEFRNDLLKAVDEKFDLHVFTVTPDGFKDLKNVHPPIMDDGLPELYARAKVNLSVDWKVDAEGYWSDRLSQILACGGNVINKYIPMQELAYPDVEHFNTIEEAIQLIGDGAGETKQKPYYVSDRVKQMLKIVEYKCLN